MTMSIFIIFPDTGNTKLHIFVGLNLPTPCALYSVLSCSVHMVYTELWGTLSGFTTTCCMRNVFYSERVSSDWLLVDIGSLDISLDNLLSLKSTKWLKIKSKTVEMLAQNSKLKKDLRVHWKIIVKLCCCTVFSHWCWLHTDLVLAIK